MEGIKSLDRATRESASIKLGSTDNGRTILADNLKHPDARVRASCIQALSDLGESGDEFLAILYKLSQSDLIAGIRAAAVRRLSALIRRTSILLSHTRKIRPLGSRQLQVGLHGLGGLARSDDPFEHHAVIQQAIHKPHLFQHPT